MPVVNTQTGVQIIVSGQGLAGPPGPSGSGGNVEDLDTLGAVGSVPTSDGAGGLVMSVPSGSGNVISPGGETAGRVTKFTGSGTIDETATTETQLATAVTHSGIVTGNPHALDAADVGAEASGAVATHASNADAHHAALHTADSHTDISSTGTQIDTAVTHSTTTTGNPHALDAADVGAEASGSIATHAANADAHHAQAHTLESHLAVATTGAQLDAHLASTTNPHGTDLGNLGSGTLAELNSAVTDATLDTSSASRPPSGTATGDLSGSFPAPVVDGIQSQAVSATTPTEGQVLVHTSGVWTPADPSGGGGPGSDTTAIHRDENSEFGGITDDPTPPGTGRLIAETAAGVKFRVDIGNLPTGGGGESNDLANAGTGISGVATPSKVGINLQSRGHAAASSMVVVGEDAPNENVTYDLVPKEIPIITLNSGFEDGSDTASLLSKVDGTRTFTITPTGADFTLWVQGVKFVIGSAQNVVWPNTTGSHHFYFDSSGVLQTAAGPVTGLDQRFKGLCAAVYWDSVGGTTLFFTTERHGFQQSPDTREFLHATVAAIWSDGLGLGILSIDGSGSDENNGHIIVGDGDYYDENLRVDILDGAPQELDPLAQIPVYWLTGTEGTPILNRRAATNFPFININDTAWPNTRIPFNELTGGVWQLTEVTNNDFCLFHIFATGSVDNPIVSFHGQAEYSSLSASRDGATDELANLVLLGIAGRESVPLGTVIVQTSNSYSNTISARIVSTLDGDYVDWRTAPRVGGGTGSVNEHNQLAGRALLSNHTQYLDLTATRPLTGNLQMALNDIVGFIPSAGTGSSASLKDFFNGALSAGLIGTGGGLSLQGTPANSVDVAAGVGLLRSIDDPLDPLRSIGWDAFNSGTLSLDTETYFGVQWNGGSPVVVAKGTDTWNYQNEFPLGNVIRDSTGRHLTPNPHSIGDAPGETARRFFETASISRDRKLGGLIIGETGTRNITLSAGAFWSRLNRIPVAALDTSVSGAVDFYYETAPSVFAVDAARTQWPNTQFGNGTALTTMTNGRYAVIWWYLGFDGDVVAQYGRDEYTKIADAEDEPVPNTAPLRIANHAGLVARTVFQKDAATAVEIGSIFSNVFASLGVQSHPDLTNINPDDHHSEAHTLESHTAVATTGAQLDGHLASTANPHATDIGNLGSGTLAELNIAVTDATLDTSSASRPPTSHAFAGADHSTSTLAQVNTKISDATIDDAGDSRTPSAHALGGAEHSVSTLAQVNTKISDATIDDSGDSRPPNGTAGGDLNGTYPNPLVDDGADGTAFHTDASGDISSLTQKVTPTGADHIFINDAANSNAPRRVLVSALPTGGGPSEIVVNVQTGATYTIVDADLGKLITFSIACVVSMNTGRAIGFHCMLQQLGTGQVTLAGTAQPNNASNHIGTRDQFSQITIISYATNLSTLGGDSSL